MYNGSNHRSQYKPYGPDNAVQYSHVGSSRLCKLPLFTCYLGFSFFKLQVSCKILVAVSPDTDGPCSVHSLQYAAGGIINQVLSCKK